MTASSFRLSRFVNRQCGLLVVAALAASALGWSSYQLNWIRQRHAARSSGALSCFPRCTPPDRERNPYDVAPLPLRIFGEDPAFAEAFYLADDATDAEVERIQSLFPETRVRRQREMLEGIDYSDDWSFLDGAPDTGGTSDVEATSDAEEHQDPEP